MQKTFNVFVKKTPYSGFFVCSKKVGGGRGLDFIEIDSTDGVIDDGAVIGACDVSRWLEWLDLDEDEVIEGQITFKFKNK